MEPSNLPSYPTPPVNPDAQSPKRRWPRWSIVGVGILAGLTGFLLWFPRQEAAPQNRLEQPPNRAETAFYTMLGNAAHQQRLRVTMYHATYASRADAKAGRNPSTVHATISEIDTISKDYRNVYAFTFKDSEIYEVGRCIGQRDFRNFSDSAAEKPRSLEAAVQKLSSLQEAAVVLPNNPCTHVGIASIALGQPTLAAARLSDGIMPVTISEAQAKKWKTALQQADLFAVKDDGMVTKDGRRLHKYSFISRAKRQDANSQLYKLFYEHAEIKKLQQASPRAEWVYEFINLGHVQSGTLGGYYLVDDTKQLPVYSELALTPTVDKEDANKAGLVRSKQKYAYPEKLTIDPATPLEILQ